MHPQNIKQNTVCDNKPFNKVVDKFMYNSFIFTWDWGSQNWGGGYLNAEAGI